MYDIKPISEINTFDYSLCYPFSDSTTVRRSNDGNLFLVYGANFTMFTHAQIEIEMKKDNWK